MEVEHFIGDTCSILRSFFEIEQGETDGALAGLPQWRERQPLDGRFPGLIPVEDPYFGCRFDPQS